MEMKNRFEWMDEAFDRGYQMGLAHGSKGSGLTWVLADKAKPDNDTDVAIALEPPKRLAKKIAKHPEEYAKPYVIAIGHYFDEDFANAIFGRAGFRLPDLVAVGDKELFAWDEVLARAYLNAPEIKNIKKGE